MISILKDTATIARERAGDTRAVESAVREIIADVRANGDAAVFKYERRFDCETLNDLRVTDGEFDNALSRADSAFLEALNIAIDNITYYHENQLRRGFDLTKPNGVRLGQIITPLKTVGAYVPGGTAAYPSSALMCLLPARVAGVERVIMATPPGRDGLINDALLVAAGACGVREVYKVGGAQAVAAMCFGTNSVPRVDKIVGPGNAYVTMAKKLLYGEVGVDMTAGPSELMILADKFSNPAHVAADMLSQAEHDRLSASILATDDMDFAQSVALEIERRLESLPRADIARESIDARGRVYVVDDMDAAIDLANAFAPEHLSICVDEPFDYLPRVFAAGSIFLGRYTPEPLADYLAGPNHVLPTGGSARFFSPLSVDDFIKKSSYLYYPREAACIDAPRAALLARLEGLEAHARSALSRANQ